MNVGFVARGPGMLGPRTAAEPCEYMRMFRVVSMQCSADVIFTKQGMNGRHTKVSRRLETAVRKKTKKEKEEEERPFPSTPTMLRAKVLPNILAQANTNGVKGTLLMNEEGSLLAMSGQSGDEVTVSAIVSNIWAQYQRARGEDSDLEYILMDCEQGRVVVTKVSTLLLCIYSDSTAQFGMLKQKAQTLREYLREPLQQVF
ncbi:Ragulator complex protein lamtor2 [Balamuthia mandrillaris]